MRLAELFLVLELCGDQRGNVDGALKKPEAHRWLLQGAVERLEDGESREEG